MIYLIMFVTLSEISMNQSIVDRRKERCVLYGGMKQPKAGGSCNDESKRKRKFLQQWRPFPSDQLTTKKNRAIHFLEKKMDADPYIEYR